VIYYAIMLTLTNLTLKLGMSYANKWEGDCQVKFCGAQLVLNPRF
jgi:hypothetical protein